MHNSSALLEHFTQLTLFLLHQYCLIADDLNGVYIRSELITVLQNIFKSLEYETKRGFWDYTIME